MKPQKQPNEWSCAPTSLAILADKDVSEIIERLGHDGSQSVPGNPHGRRCFCDLEIIRVAFDLGIYLVPLFRYFQIAPGIDYRMDDQTFKRILDRFPGLLAGIRVASGLPHMVAWLPHSIVDPAGGVSELFGYLDNHLNVEVFYAWMNCPLFTNTSPSQKERESVTQGNMTNMNRSV